MWSQVTALPPHAALKTADGILISARQTFSQIHEGHGRMELGTLYIHFGSALLRTGHVQACTVKLEFAAGLGGGKVKYPLR